MRARAAATPAGVADLHLDEPAHRSPAHARRRRRDRAARARDHPEPRQRLLRRRRRAARRRLARARARGDEQVWTSILYRALAFLHAAAGDGGMRNFMGYDRRWLDEPHVGDHVGRSIWALGEILATAWIPAVVGRRATCSTGSSRRSTATSPCARRRTPCSASRASTPTGSSPAAHRLLERLVDQLADAYEHTALGRLALVRGRAHLRQRPPLASADHRRRRARPGRPRRGRARVAPLARRRVRARRERAPASRAPRPAPGRAGARAPATSSRSTPPRSSRPS